ncbi:SigB/SigF/SigG family RNA polymerase sigma factor [Actinomadura scrupuli]|uniref:SigB/SigF/SigG family RNA polymerase sigma factor n=1 Tax=Actinomadura scrupuli TaxID=559629 RepID=UPI003D970735
MVSQLPPDSAFPVPASEPVSQVAPAGEPLPPPEGRAEALLAEMAALPEGDRRRERLRTELVEAHTWFVRSLARRYAGRGEPLEDIEQAGLLGLINAIDRFDPQRGERFLAYAASMVSGEVKHHFRDRTWLIRVPRRLQELRITMRETIREFTNAHGRAPTVAEIATLLEITEEEVIDVIGATDAYQPASLDTPVGEADGRTLGDMLDSDDDGVTGIVDQAALRPLLDRLPDRDRTIVLLRFWGNQTQSRIAEQLGISQMHVSRLLSRSLAYLRTELLKDA